MTNQTSDRVAHSSARRYQIVTDSEQRARARVIHALPMKRFARRTFAGAAGLFPTLFVPGLAQATLLRGLSLRDMTQRSHSVLLLSALDSRCSHASIGGRRLIVTETRARVEDVFAKAVPDAGEVLVRTLGGVLDGVGQLVHGQAEFSSALPSVVFLTRAKDESLWVTGMAQGHYPVVARAGAKRVLDASAHLPTLVDFEHSAVRRLVGQELAEARRLVIEASLQ